MGVEDREDRMARSRTLALWVVLALVLVGALLWVLLYGARMVKESWMRKNEAQARTTLTVISRALQAYHEKHDGYPDRLQRLGGKGEGPPETAPPERARLLEAALAHNRFEKDGYRFRYQAGQAQQRWAATVQLLDSYRLTAEPLAPGGSGEWFYYADQSGGIRARKGEAASPDDPVAE